jgi:very-short-patch-repair endonuclease
MWYTKTLGVRGTKKKSRTEQYAKNMRDNPTRAEGIFEEALMALCSNLGIRYHSQHVWRINRFKSYISDFYIPSKRLCIEIDGGYHSTRKQKKKDNIKDTTLACYCGVQTIRFTNSEVEGDIENVIKSISSILTGGDSNS